MITEKDYNVLQKLYNVILKQIKENNNERKDK